MILDSDGTTDGSSASACSEDWAGKRCRPGAVITAPDQQPQSRKHQKPIQPAGWLLGRVCSVSADDPGEAGAAGVEGAVSREGAGTRARGGAAEAGEEKNGD
jgi:hypothetical protein